MKKMYRVGIAGYGIVGKRRLLAIDKNSNLNVVAVCDKNHFQNDLKDSKILFFDNYKDLLKIPIDILFVCMTNDINPIVTIAGLKRGLHVFCEKPPGRSVEDVLNTMKIEKKNKNLKLMYGFNHRFHGSVQRALEITKKHTLGNIINLRGVYGKSQLITFNQPLWRTKRKISGGGVLLDQGIHMVDLIQLFIGNITEVNSFITNSFWKHDVEDNAYAIMKNKDNVVCMLHSSATQWRHRFELDINFEKGNLILSGILSSSKSYGFESLTIIKADPLRDNGSPKEEKILFSEDKSWETEINEFTKSIIHGKEISSGNSKDALNTMKTVFAIYYADKKWRHKFSIPKP